MRLCICKVLGVYFDIFIPADDLLAYDSFVFVSALVIEFAKPSIEGFAFGSAWIDNFEKVFCKLLFFGSRFSDSLLMEVW